MHAVIVDICATSFKIQSVAVAAGISGPVATAAVQTCVKQLSRVAVVFSGT